jgi:hypothetical protein
VGEPGHADVNAGPANTSVNSENRLLAGNSAQALLQPGAAVRSTTNEDTRPRNSTTPGGPRT